MDRVDEDTLARAEGDRRVVAQRNAAIEATCRGGFLVLGVRRGREPERK